jgi:AbrB family looped-hinge helix DNA binding protein
LHLHTTSAERGTSDQEGRMQPVRAKVATGGRIVIPAEFRKALGIQVGQDVLLTIDHDEVRILTWPQAVERARQIVGQWAPGERCLSDELIAERRAEAARE